MHQTRESWLTAAVEALRPFFAPIGEIPPYRVTCGFPSKSATARKNRRLGECWPASASAANVNEIFISPVVSDRIEVLAILTHEVAHAVVGLEHGHKGPFKRAVKLLHLEGKPSSTKAGDQFKLQVAESILRHMGDYPHGTLTPSSQEKKQSTRMLKCVCPDCGYTVRTTSKWLDDVGPPLCPDGRIPMTLT